MTATPRCPYCNAKDFKHLTRQVLGNFMVVYCGQCGAIYGVMPVSTLQTKKQTATSHPKTASPGSENVKTPLPLSSSPNKQPDLT